MHVLCIKTIEILITQIIVESVNILYVTEFEFEFKNQIYNFCIAVFHRQVSFVLLYSIWFFFNNE